ncbi:hypothetical protein SUGI_0708870 [Cryptomeria japonica]|nr:hypothetical protein SUGI_0708870 [Cryptomeria japonica]
MAIAKEITRRVVDQTSRLIRECTMKCIKYVSREHIFSEFENAKNSPYDKHIGDETPIRTPESQWTPIQSPITGFRDKLLGINVILFVPQILKKRSSSYIPMRSTRQRTSSYIPLVNKKPMEVEKQNVKSAFEFQVPRQSREAACKILGHLEQTFKGPSSSEFSENLTTVSSSNGLATPALGIRVSTKSLMTRNMLATMLLEIQLFIVLINEGKSVVEECQWGGNFNRTLQTLPSGTPQTSHFSGNMEDFQEGWLLLGSCGVRFNFSSPWTLYNFLTKPNRRKGMDIPPNWNYSYTNFNNLP